jgi:hypothetical protein
MTLAEDLLKKSASSEGVSKAAGVLTKLDPAIFILIGFVVFVIFVAVLVIMYRPRDAEVGGASPKDAPIPGKRPILDSLRGDGDGLVNLLEPGGVFKDA